MSYKETDFPLYDDRCLAEESPQKPLLFYTAAQTLTTDIQASGSLPVAEHITQLSSFDRDAWFLDDASTALASVTAAEFEGYHDETQAIPAPQLEHALLYAGHETFEDLQNYTWERIRQLFVDIGISDYHDHFPNISKAFGIVEDLMETMGARRTGEPSVAHIYRNVLRIIEFIEGYNKIYTDRNEPLIFTPEIAEFYICATAMHDFLEDYSMIPGAGYHRGGCEEMRKTEFEQWGHGAHFYRAISPEPNSPAEDKIHEVTLDFGDHENDMFVSTLVALKSDNVEAGQLMDHLEGTVDALQGRYDQHIVQNQLYSLAAYVIKCCDRLDNNATYLFSRASTGELIATPAGRVYKKAMENLELFRDVLDVLKRIAGHDRMTNNDIAGLKPFYLKYDPTRWSKLILAGVPLNVVYHPNEKGKGIAKIL